MQQILNPKQAASGTDLVQEQGKKNGKDKTEEAGTTIISEPFSEAPLHMLVVSLKQVHHSSRMYRSILTDLFILSHYLAHCSHTHTHTHTHTQKWTKL